MPLNETAPVYNNVYFYKRIGKKNAKLPISQLPSHFTEYALLSAKVYIDDDNNATIPAPAGWEKWMQQDVPEIPAPPSEKHKFIGGMGYQVWQKKADGKYTVAIVFRGTDFPERNDWHTNLRWAPLNFFGRKGYEKRYWDQYHQVRKLVPMLVEIIKNRHGDNLKEIVSTGHSLGGGLAQQASYCCADIKNVIVFDSSPVTGYKDIVPKNVRKKNQENTYIERVHQKGEVLSYVRSVALFFFPLTAKNPEIIVYELNFLKGHLVAKHSIEGLAIKLLEADKEISG